MSCPIFINMIYCLINIFNYFYTNYIIKIFLSPFIILNFCSSIYYIKNFLSPLTSTSFSFNASNIIGKNSFCYFFHLQRSFSSALHTDGLLVFALITMFFLPFLNLHHNQHTHGKFPVPVSITGTVAF